MFLFLKAAIVRQCITEAHKAKFIPYKRQQSKGICMEQGFRNTQYSFRTIETFYSFYKRAQARLVSVLNRNIQLVVQARLRGSLEIMVN